MLFRSNPITALTNAIGYLQARAAAHRNRTTQISSEIADALENYVDELRAARDDLQRPQQQPQQPQPQGLPTADVTSILRDIENAMQNAIQLAENDVSPEVARYVQGILSDRFHTHLQEGGISPNEIVDRLTNFSNEIDNFTNRLQTNPMSRTATDAAPAIQEFATHLRGILRYAERRLAEVNQLPAQQLQQPTVDDVMNAMMLNRPQNEVHAYELLHRAFDDVFNLDE